MRLNVSNISRSYRQTEGWFRLPQSRKPVKALEDVTFAGSGGEIIGLTGPNGAGKSTLLKILAGLLPPDSGSFSIGGLFSGNNDAQIRSETALAAANPRSFYQRLSARQNLEFFGALYGLAGPETMKRAKNLSEILRVAGSDHEKRFETLSEGTMQKFALIRTLTRDFKLLLLDEPARSLDHEAAEGLLAYLKELAAARGKLVIYASHDMRELAEVSDRALILRNGKLETELDGIALKKAAVSERSQA